MATPAPETHRGTAAAGRVPSLLLPFALFLMVTGCPYSVRGNLPSHLSSVSVPAFRSQVTEYGLEQQLTSLVVESMVSDGRLAVVNTDADAILRATITSFSRTPYSYTSAEVVEEYRLQISVRLDFEDRVQGVDLLEDDTVSEWVVYDPSSEPYNGARDRLMEETAAEIVRRTLSGW